MRRPPCTCRAGRECRPCRLIRTRSDYRQLWGVEPLVLAVETTPRIPLVVRICSHRGVSLTTEEKADRDLDQLKDHYFCHHDAKPLGPHPCPTCQGCGPKCRGYTSEIPK